MRILFSVYGRADQYGESAYHGDQYLSERDALAVIQRHGVLETGGRWYETAAQVVAVFA